jgi:hypothetical protein
MNIQLTVAKVEFGGNTGEGKYFYAFSPKTVIIKNNHSPIQISFTKSTSDDFEMVSLLSTDNHNTLTKPIFAIGNRSLEVQTTNSQQQLINVSVLVRDMSDGSLINCDPQVLNDPDPEI